MKKLLLKPYENDHSRLWTPAFPQDMAMFRHCTDGMIAITAEKAAVLNGVFEVHGYELATFEGEQA